MVKILDRFGEPIKRELLLEPQTAKLTHLNNEFAAHPSRGLTPGKLARILADAEQGDIIAQCDLFEDMEEKDGHIFAEMSKRKRALMGLQWSIEPPLHNPTAQEKKQAEQVSELFSGIDDIEDVMFDMMDAAGKGFACLEIEWERLGNTFLPKAIEHQLQRNFIVKRNEIRLRDNSMLGEELWPFGWIVHIHKARSGHIARSGLHRTLAWPYLFKNYSVRDLAEFLEIYGLPLRLGTYPRGADDNEKMTLLRAVASIGHDAAGIVPEGMMIDFKEPAKGDKEPFEYMMDWCERTQSKVIVGATLTSQTDSGSGAMALGNVHMDVMHDLVISDARQVQSSLSRCLVYPVASLNIPGIDPNRAPRLVYDTHECEDITAYSEAIPKLVGVGMEIPEDYVHEKLGIPKKQEGERVLTTGTQQAPPTNEAVLRSLAILRREDSDVDMPELYADQLEQQTNAMLTRYLKPIQSLIDNADSLEEIRDGLTSIYPDLDETELLAVLQRGLAASTMAGRFEGKEGR
ncbi:MAG: DUF935 family protein [Gammaproteobacteria bacterium]|nr:DUF935 family protein [Gammaproteobacteria bacterium]